MQPIASRRFRREGGFNLIEIMIALGIFATGVLALTAFQLEGMRVGNGGRHATRAAAIAKTQMELFQNLAWAQIAPTGGWSAVQTVSDTVQGKAETNYRLQWRITNLVNGWTRTIDVRVLWDDPNRANRSVVFTSVRFNREAV